MHSFLPEFLFVISAIVFFATIALVIPTLFFEKPKKNEAVVSLDLVSKKIQDERLQQKIAPYIEKHRQL